MSPLKEEEIDVLRPQVPQWEVVNNHHLEKTFPCKNFVEAMALANQVATLAEQENHHPDLLIKYGSLTITIWTHKIEGLHENDFILAAKCDAIAPD